MHEAISTKRGAEPGSVPVPRVPPEWTTYVAALAERLRTLRIARGLTQEEVAYAAGLSRATYQRYERPEPGAGLPANPDLRYMMAIAQVFEVSLDDLLPAPWPDLQPGRVRRRAAG